MARHFTQCCSNNRRVNPMDISPCFPIHPHTFSLFCLSTYLFSFILYHNLSAGTLSRLPFLLLQRFRLSSRTLTHRTLPINVCIRSFIASLRLDFKCSSSADATPLPSNKTMPMILPSIWTSIVLWALDSSPQTNFPTDRTAGPTS